MRRRLVFRAIRLAFLALLEHLCFKCQNLGFEMVYYPLSVMVQLLVLGVGSVDLALQPLHRLQMLCPHLLQLLSCLVALGSQLVRARVRHVWRKSCRL
jgi:hypothetical protein